MRETQKSASEGKEKSGNELEEKSGSELEENSKQSLTEEKNGEPRGKREKKRDKVVVRKKRKVSAFVEKSEIKIHCLQGKSFFYLCTKMFISILTNLTLLFLVLCFLYCRNFKTYSLRRFHMAYHHFKALNIKLIS